jgi:DNA-binding CsgD family transcriptional regulator
MGYLSIHVRPRSCAWEIRGRTEGNAKRIIYPIFSIAYNKQAHKLLSERQNVCYDVRVSATPARKEIKLMMNETPSPSGRAQARAKRRARRQARIAEREGYFELLASGFTCRQIAEAAKVDVKTVKRAIDRAIDERRLDAPDRYVHLQVARLTKALRLADASLERGELKAVGPMVRLVGALDRYHGLGPGSAASRPAASEPPAALAPPPLALPAPPPALPAPVTDREGELIRAAEALAPSSPEAG